MEAGDGEKTRSKQGPDPTLAMPWQSPFRPLWHHARLPPCWTCGSNVHFIGHPVYHSLVNRLCVIVGTVYLVGWDWVDVQDVWLLILNR